MSTPPFSIGDKIYLVDSPQHGSVRVTAVEPHPKGGWTITAGSEGRYTVGPAAHYRICPARWTEPPLMPAGSVRLSLSEADRVAAKEQDDANIAYLTEMDRWIGRMQAWLALLRQTDPEPDTSDIPEVGEDWFKRARVVYPTP